MRTFEIACKYVDAGFSVIPIKPDGSKEPALSSWNLYKDPDPKKKVKQESRKPTCKELHQWFWNTRHGIGIVGGIISGGLEIIDFDDASLFDPWFAALPTGLSSKLTVVKTPGGWHVYYRCDEIGGNTKIAMDPDGKKQTLIETRASGGMVLAPGCPPWCHPSGKTYKRDRGPSLLSLTRIAPDERRTLFAAAREFDKRSQREKERLAARAQRKNLEGFKVTAGNGHGNLSGINFETPEPIKKFNQWKEWADLLLPCGWKSSDGEHWTRPGKQNGCSARIVVSDTGEKLLTVFSGNAGPLAPSGSFKTFDKFSAWVMLNHGGNRSAAFKEILEASR